MTFKQILLRLPAMRYRLLLLLFMLLNLSENPLKAQSMEYAVDANIIYHFTKYIDWSSDVRPGDFIIGVYGDDAAYEEFKKATMNKQVGNKKIVVRQIESLNETTACMILFITAEESNMMKKINQIIPGYPVLIVTEKEGMALKGACINFIVVNEKLKIEINKKNIANRKLKIAGELLQMGTAID